MTTSRSWRVLFVLAAACSRSSSGASGQPDDASPAPRALAAADADASDESVAALLRAWVTSKLTSGPKPADLAEAERKLRDARAAATPDERALIDRALALIARTERLMTDAEGVSRDDVRELVLDQIALMRDYEAVYPADVKVACARAATAYQVSGTSSLGIDPATSAALRREGLDASKALVKRFPQEACAHSARAWTCQGEGEDPLVCLRELRRCVELDASRCNDEYQRAADQYTRPFCITQHIKPTLEVRSDDEVVLTAKDIREIRATTQRSFSSTWDADAGAFIERADEPTPAILFVMTDAGSNKLAIATQALASKKGDLRVMDGTVTLHTARVRSVLRGSFEISGGSGPPSIARFCQPVDQRALPPDVR